MNIIYTILQFILFGILFYFSCGIYSRNKNEIQKYFSNIWDCLSEVPKWLIWFFIIVIVFSAAFVVSDFFIISFFIWLFFCFFMPLLLFFFIKKKKLFILFQAFLFLGTVMFALSFPFLLDSMNSARDFFGKKIFENYSVYYTEETQNCVGSNRYDCESEVMVPHVNTGTSFGDFIIERAFSYLFTFILFLIIIFSIKLNIIIQKKYSN